MSAEENTLSREEELQAENDFLKMKLMLESDATFVKPEGVEFEPELENEFLRHIVEFERQFDAGAQVKIFDRLGRPVQFRSPKDLNDEEVESSWEELQDLMGSHGLNLHVCSPYISKRELYRFAIEELMEMEMDDIHIPGFSCNYIYDEFYPDPRYETESMIGNALFWFLFPSHPFEYDWHRHKFTRKDIRMNGVVYSNYAQLVKKIEPFHQLFSEFEVQHCEVESCELDEFTSRVTGSYCVSAKMKSLETFYKGRVSVFLEKDGDGYWQIREFEIGGLEL